MSEPLSPDAPEQGMPPNLSSEDSQTDISKGTIMMLLVLTIFVSAFGTWMVLKATDNVLINSESSTSAQTTGHVDVSILASNEQPVQQSVAAGYATVNIKARSEAQAQ